MRFRRIAAAAAVAAVAGGGALVISSTAGSATTPVTPLSLGLLGMSSTACPLPLNGSMAIKPDTTVRFMPDSVLGQYETLSVSYVRETTSNPKPTPTTKQISNAGWDVVFPVAGTYDLSWHTVSLGPLGVQILGATTTGKLVVDPNAKLVADQQTGKCVIAVQVPTPSVSAPVVPSPVTSIVNGVVNGVVSSVNGVLNPVNSAVGPILGGATGLPIPGGGTPGGGVPGGGVPGVGTNYHPTGPTVAQRTVPQGYGNGSGVGGTYVPAGSGGSLAGGATGTGSGTSKSEATGQQQPTKSGGSPKTVQLASDKPRSALDGWSALIVLAAVLALSGATAFYARSYLLNPTPAKVKA